MKFIHTREYLDRNQCFRVDCDTQCNLLLTDDLNFSRYKRRESYRYFGGFYKRFPAFLKPPSPGHWNLTLDLGGGEANIRYSMTVVNDGVLIEPLVTENQ